MTRNPSKRLESLAYSAGVLVALALIAAAGFLVGVTIAALRFVFR